RAATHSFDDWDDRKSPLDSELDDPYDLTLAPDRYHKADISGGAAYGIELPFLGADPIFANEDHGLPFVDYLRLAFRCGGFPRLDRHHAEPGVRELIAALSDGLEPF